MHCTLRAALQHMQLHEPLQCPKHARLLLVESFSVHSWIEPCTPFDSALCCANRSCTSVAQTMALRTGTLDLNSTGLPHGNMHCRWSPAGEKIMVANFIRTSYHRGYGNIFDAKSGIQLDDFHIEASLLWPQWPRLAADDPSRA